MLKSNLCNCSDAYILVSRNITISKRASQGVDSNDNNKQAVFINNINNIKADNAKDFDVVMLMYNLIEYSGNYSETFESFWKYYRDERNLNNNGVINDFTGANNNSTSVKFKQ